MRLDVISVSALDVVFVFAVACVVCFSPACCRLQELKRSSAQEATVIPASVSPDASVPGRVTAHWTQWPPSGSSHVLKRAVKAE